MTSTLPFSQLCQHVVRVTLTLIQAIVEVMQPRPGEVVCDPACGTDGFLLAAHHFIRKHHKLDKAQLRFLNAEQLRGVELVDSVARLCCTNLVLHGIGSDAAHVPVQVKDSARRQARRI